MSQTPTYWRMLKLQLVERAIAYAEVLERGNAEGADDSRALSDSYSRWSWALFELGPRNVSAMVVRDLARHGDDVDPTKRTAKETLVATASAMLKVESFLNDPDPDRRSVWRKASDAYDDAVQALGPREIAALVQRDLPRPTPRLNPNPVADESQDTEGAGDTPCDPDLPRP